MTGNPRPPLPVRHENPHVKDLVKTGSLPAVKYQILNCQGSDILVGRLKVDTPTTTGHAFILRRFDTGAVSLTTMFRAAFPNAPDDAEKREVQWVKDTYDLAGNNGSSKDTTITRLAGTWVSPAVALELGVSYSLGDLIQSVVDARPDPTANYRRSGNKSTSKDAVATVPTSSVSQTAHALPTPSPTHATPNPAKRRKESSPAPPAAPVTPLPTRRSTRTKSPNPRSAPMPSLTSVAKSVKKTARREEVVTPGGSDETAVDEDGDVVEESVGTELREQDLAEQRDMIQDLKAQRDKALAAKQRKSASDAPAKLKRVREDEEKPLEFEFKEPEIGDRVIATNRRITPSQKSAVWGLMAFAFGMTAVSFLPNLF